MKIFTLTNCTHLNKTNLTHTGKGREHGPRPRVPQAFPGGRSPQVPSSASRKPLGAGKHATAGKGKRGWPGRRGPRKNGRVRHGRPKGAARVDASCEQPVKPGRFLTSHQPGTIRAGNEAGKCGRIPGKRVLWRQGMDMKKRILTYLQFSLQGTGVAALGTLNIYEPKAETLIFGGVCIICGLIIAIVNKEA